ncbi:hypothetical protein [Chryseobacterium sp. MP_3.2]|uniref:hypothetical protein n=1 Tax=Chryseobacterium sp. MP_3.2 TaxID=3071712 RepID=UPI002DFD664F|nr:hypothetical protein [Chryseobacterium sp. MP_3.2]
MKNLILFLAVANLTFAQSLKPTLGIHWTGGTTYKNDVEMPSAQLGLIYTPKTPDLIMSNIGISANYYYNFINEIPEKNNTDFYVLRLQFAKRVLEWWNITYYVGYANTFDNNITKSITGPYKNNFAYGIGIQTFDNGMTGELLYENIAGYPYLSVGVNLNLMNLLKKKDNLKDGELKY